MHLLESNAIWCLFSMIWLFLTRFEQQVTSVGHFDAVTNIELSALNLRTLLEYLWQESYYPLSDEHEKR